MRALLSEFLASPWLCLSSRLLRDVDGKQRYLPFKLNFLNFSLSQSRYDHDEFFPFRSPTASLHFLVVFYFIRSTSVTLVAKRNEHRKKKEERQSTRHLNVNFHGHKSIHRIHPVGNERLCHIGEWKSSALLTVEINWIPSSLCLALQFLCCRKQSVATVQLFVHWTLAWRNRTNAMNGK